MKQDRKANILSTAQHLFLSEGLSVTTVRIAKDADVPHGMLLDYFATKQDLQDGLYVTLRNEAAEAMYDAGAMEKDSLQAILSTVWASYVHWAMANMQKHKMLMLLATSNAVTAPARAKVEETLKPLNRIVQSEMKKGDVTEMGLDYLYLIMDALAHICIVEAIDKRLKGKTLDGHIALGFSIFWKGIAA